MAFIASLALSFLSLLLAHVFPSVATPYAGTIVMPIDHFNISDTRTFLNRYWMNDSYYKPGGPVFLYDGGEAGLSAAQAAGPLTENGGSIISSLLELTRTYHGVAIVWEHRFYGESLPFTLDNTTGVAIDGFEAYKYLNNEQALEDVVYLAHNFQPPGHGYSLVANSTPWVFIGASYPGARAAMIRVRNPETIFASWSSSGVVQAQWNFSDWWNPVYHSMPSNCSADTHAAITYADNIMANGTPEDISLLKRIVSLTNAVNPRQEHFGVPYPTDFEELSYWQMANILGYVYQGSFFNFQSGGYEVSLSAFCDQMQSWNPSNFTGFNIDSPASVLGNNSDDSPITSLGIAATYGPENAFYAYIYSTIRKELEDWARDSFIPQIRTSADNAAWIWQLCTEMAQFQVTQFPDPHSLVSKFYNLTGVTDHFCRDTLPFAAPQPDVQKILKYGGWHMRPSNVMFTNGELDPFRGVTVQATTKYASMAPDRPSTTVVPACNVPPEGNYVFGRIWKGQVHGSDIQRQAGNITGLDPVTEGIKLFGQALDAWLPCFKPKDLLMTNL